MRGLVALVLRRPLQPGACADIVIFNPDTVNDPATYEDPHQCAKGFTEVIVNGGIVLRDGELTGTRSGGPLRFNGSE